MKILTLPCVLFPALPFLTNGLASAQALRALPDDRANPRESPPASFFWGDFDQDRLADAFVIAPSGEARLLRNRGGGSLEDVTDEAGLARARGARFALWEDLDRDGDLDLFVGMLDGSSLLLSNQNGASFADVTASSGIAHLAPALDAGFVDYDRDGLPDLEVRTGEESLLYHNLGKIFFERIDLGLEPSGLAPNVSPVSLMGQVTQAPGSSAPKSPPSSGSTDLAGRDPLARPDGQPVEVESPRDLSLAGLPPTPGSLDATPFPACALAIKDQDGSGCLQASSIPTLGMLFPVSSNLFVDFPTGRVGVNDTTPSTRLDVTQTDFGQLSAVRADGVSGPNRGYLAVEGRDDFDGVSSADWNGLEIGVAGISTGTSIPTTDNYGVLGHANAVAVRGEFSGDPAGTFGELGTFNGVGIRADGSTLAGEFLGDVDINDGVVNVTEGSVVVSNSTDSTALLDIISSVSTLGGRVINFDRTVSQAAANDIVEISIPAGSSLASQYIECDNSGEIDFRVDGDGEIFSDVGVTIPADFAEMIRVASGADSVAPGEVLVIDPASLRSVVKSNAPHSTLVCGVYSTKPGVVGSEREWDVPAPAGSLEALAGESIPLKRADMARLYDEVPVAVVGIVPTKISAENGAIRPGDLLDGDDVAGAAVELFNDAGLETIELDSDNGGDGFVTIRNEAGSSRIALDGGQTDLGADLSLFAADGSTTLFLDAESTNSGGLVSVRNDSSNVTVELIGDTGFGSSGAVSLFDRVNGANSVIIRGRDSSGTGGEILMTGRTGGLTVDIDASSEALFGDGGGLKFNEDDGSLMCDLIDTLYTFNDESGAITISFDRTSGTKNAVVGTESYGRRMLYCMESPEVWFEDFGSAQLQGGVAVVRLDPMFLETVTIDEEHPMKVFVTLYGPNSGTWIERGADHFVVHENPGGAGAVDFDWRVVAKRKGLETLRLRSLDEALAAEGSSGGDPPTSFQPMQPPHEGIEGGIDGVIEGEPSAPE